MRFGIIGLLLVATCLGCGDGVVDVIPGPRGSGVLPGFYSVTDFFYENLCYGPDEVFTLFLPPVETNNLRFQVKVADSVSGLLDAQGGPYIVRGAYGGDTAQYPVIFGGLGRWGIFRDTLWAMVANNQWISVVPFSQYLDGVIGGEITLPCGVGTEYLRFEIRR